MGKSRHSNEAFLKEDDKICYVAEPDADRTTTSNTVYLNKHLKDTAVADKKKSCISKLEKSSKIFPVK